MMVKLLRGAKITCWNCGKQQDDKVEDYVVPGRIGQPSGQEHECPWCEAYFTVECTAVDQYQVTNV